MTLVIVVFLVSSYTSSTLNSICHDHSSFIVKEMSTLHFCGTHGKNPAFFLLIRL